MGEQGYREQQKFNDSKEKIVEGIVIDMETDSDDVYTIEINGKDYNLGDYIYYSDDLKEVYTKIDINDTVVIYESEKGYVTSNGAMRDNAYQIECNDEIIYNVFPDKTIDDHIRVCQMGVIVCFIIIWLVSSVILDFLYDDTIEPKLREKQRKKQELEEERKTKNICRKCNVENVKEAKYCNLCGRKL